MGELRYAVSLEICHIVTAEQAERLALEIKNRLSDINEDIYVCVGSYEQVRQRSKETVDLTI